MNRTKVVGKMINLFVHTPGRSLALKPKVVSILAEDLKNVKLIGSGMEKSGDVITLSPQAKNAAERIKELKSRVKIDSTGRTATYEEFFHQMQDFSEDYKLTMWNILTRSVNIPKSTEKCIAEVAKCFETKNLKKIGFFKNLSEQEIKLLHKSNGIDREQLMAVLSGHKPAYFDTSRDGVINFAKAIKGTKYADEFLAINEKSKPKHFCILNKRQVREIVGNNKEIYCRELGLDVNTPTEDVYKKWLECIENGGPTQDQPLAFGLTLGYPKFSSIIYTLETSCINNDRALCDVWKLSYGEDYVKYKEILLKAFRHEDSPFKKYSEEFKRDFEHYVRTEDFRPFINPFEERFYSTFKLFGSDSADMKRIVENEVDFVNNFRMEQLF